MITAKKSRTARAIPLPIATGHCERSAAIKTRIFVATAVLFLTLVTPAQAKYSGGTGEPNDPYQIATAADLIALGETPEDYGKHFILTADIDLDPNLPGRKVFDKAVIAPDTDSAQDGFQGFAFTGLFDGSGHTVSHLTITGKDWVGLFGLFGRLGEWPPSGGDVKDLGLIDVNITGSGDFVGGVVGDNWWGSVTNSYSTGLVNGDSYVGGLVGWNNSNVTECYSTGSVRGIDYVGGLVGVNGWGSIVASYSSGSVTGNGDVGGLAGVNGVGEDIGSVGGSITNSYSSCSVRGNYDVGGLVGTNDWGSIATSYSSGSVRGGNDVGGLVGVNENGTIRTSYSSGSVSGHDLVCGFVPDVRGVSHCVWDMETSGQAGTSGGVGLTSVEMMDPYMLGLNGFANDPNWILDAGRDYPRLAWEGTPGQTIPQPTIDWLEGQGTSDVPYRIDTADQLILLGKASILWNRYFVLGADIDLDPALTGRGIFQRAVIPDFAGVFDGGGHVISHLTIRGGSCLGLFGQLKALAEVRNVGVIGANIIDSGDVVGALVGDNWGGTLSQCYSTGEVKGSSNVGGLVGSNGDWYSEGGVLINCYSTGSVSGDSSVGGLVGWNWGSVTSSYSSGSVSGYADVGGLMGHNGDYGSIATSYSSGSVNGIRDGVGGLAGGNDGSITTSYSSSSVSGKDDVGGLVGFSSGSIITSYSSASVSGRNDVGGLVGDNYKGSIGSSYSMGSVSGTSWVGGLAGLNRGSVTSSYSTGSVTGTGNYVGGLVGAGSATSVTSSFWDIQTSGQTTSTGGTGKFTSEMQRAKTFLDAGWDFVGETANGTEDVWWILEGKDYPRLWWETAPQ